MLKNQKKKLTWKFRKEIKAMKKKQPNLNLRKELLKSYLFKLTNNKVALIENIIEKKTKETIT